MKVKYAYYEEFAKYFDLLASADKNKINIFLKFLVSSFNKIKIPVKLVLELACGSGRFTIPLANKGYKIIATDPSKAYLDLAKKKAKKNKLSIKFIRKDMRKIKYKDKFDAIFCKEAIYYMLNKKDLLTTFNCVNKALKKDGAFIFDIPNWKKSWKEREIFYIKKGGTIFFSGIHLFKDVKKKLIIHDALVFAVDKGKIKTGIDKHILKMWKPEELKLYLLQAGFTKVMLLDLDTSKSFTNKSKRLAVIAIK